MRKQEDMTTRAKTQTAYYAGKCGMDVVAMVGGVIIAADGIKNLYVGTGGTTVLAVSGVGAVATPEILDLSPVEIGDKNDKCRKKNKY